MHKNSLELILKGELSFSSENAHYTQPQILEISYCFPLICSIYESKSILNYEKTDTASIQWMFFVCSSRLLCIKLCPYNKARHGCNMWFSHITIIQSINHHKENCHTHALMICGLLLEFKYWTVGGIILHYIE